MATKIFKNTSELTPLQVEKRRVRDFGSVCIWSHLRLRLLSVVLGKLSYMTLPSPHGLSFRLYAIRSGQPGRVIFSCFVRPKPHFLGPGCQPLGPFNTRSIINYIIDGFLYEKKSNALGGIETGATDVKEASGSRGALWPG